MVATVLPAADVTIAQLATEQGRIVIDLAPTGEEAACPLCGACSRRVQSRYTRTLADLPWQGAAVCVRLHVRRFWCDAPECPRTIFAERVPTLAAPYARRTARLAGVLTLVGFALGGEGGARLLAALGMAASPDTLLRLVRAAPLPVAATPRVLGVDDFALRRGHTYGTLLIDLETHRPVDLLPERTADGLSSWLAAHPGVEVVSRDRSGVYADGARRGAPAAVQVADRWHLLKNVGDALERVVARHPEALRTATVPDDTVVLPDGVGNDADDPVSAAAMPARSSANHDCAQRRARRLARYKEVIALHQSGVSIRAIGARVGLSRVTVRKLLRAGAFPEHAQRRTRLTPLTAHEAYLRERWAAGCDNAAALWRELHGRGFTGSEGMVRRYVGRWRSGPRRPGRRPRGSATVGTPPVGTPPPCRVRWWLLRDPEKRGERQGAYVDRLLAACPTLRAASDLAREFGRLLRARDAAALDPWLDRAAASGIAEFAGCAASLRQDYAAVAAALRETWSNGQTEGQVTRLKLLKRQMYGRAGFDLLRRRVLHHAA